MQCNLTNCDQCLNDYNLFIIFNNKTNTFATCTKHLQCFFRKLSNILEPATSIPSTTFACDNFLAVYRAVYESPQRSYTNILTSHIEENSYISVGINGRGLYTFKFPDKSSNRFQLIDSTYSYIKDINVDKFLDTFSDVDYIYGISTDAGNETVLFRTCKHTYDGHYKFTSSPDYEDNLEPDEAGKGSYTSVSVDCEATNQSAFHSKVIGNNLLLYYKLSENQILICEVNLDEFNRIVDETRRHCLNTKEVIENKKLKTRTRCVGIDNTIKTEKWVSCHTYKSLNDLRFC